MTPTHSMRILSQPLYLMNLVMNLMVTVHSIMEYASVVFSNPSQYLSSVLEKDQIHT